VRPGRSGQTAADTTKRHGLKFAKSHSAPAGRRPRSSIAQSRSAIQPTADVGAEKSGGLQTSAVGKAVQFRTIASKLGRELVGPVQRAPSAGPNPSAAWPARGWSRHDVRSIATLTQRGSYKRAGAEYFFLGQEISGASWP